jgi:hypothetical protein
MSRNLFAWTIVGAFAVGFCTLNAEAQSYPNMATLSNPNWYVMLTDAGYSDDLIDNTPGFEGREYLSGEWGAAVGYQRAGTTVMPTWLERQFIYPDWTTNSNFNVLNPITITGQAFGGLDAMASSTLANPDLRVDLSYEMIDTVTGMKMGRSKASAASGSSLDSNRYVLKQTYTLTNISGTTLSNLSLFQFLHGLNAVESLYDNRSYAGPLANYRYDLTQLAIDPSYAWSGGSTLRDYISFGSRVAPVAVDNGRYGIAGVDDHVTTGKPSVGVHLAIENDALSGSDDFADATTPWVGGAQKYSLGTLLDGESASLDLMLSVRTGTVISTSGTDCSGSANGGSGHVGGVDFLFEKILTPGDFFAEYGVADAQEMALRIAAGEFGIPTFAQPGAMQLFELDFEGEYDGAVQLTFAYDAAQFPAGLDESQLQMFHYKGGQWQNLGGIVDPVAHTITVTTENFSPFAIGMVPEPAALAVLTALAAVFAARR